MSEPFLGEIKMVGFNFAPRGWALCDGQLLPISQNTALFSLLGTTFGGDGRTTFSLPDLRGRDAVHVGNGPGLTAIRWGQKVGREDVNLTVQNLPAHSHNLVANNTEDGANEQSPANAFLANGQDIYNAAQGTAATMNSASVQNTGGNQAVNIRNPLLGIYHCIALTGIYPSRS